MGRELSSHVLFKQQGRRLTMTVLKPHWHILGDAINQALVTAKKERDTTRAAMNDKSAMYSNREYDNLLKHVNRQIKVIEDCQSALRLIYDEKVT